MQSCVQFLKKPCVYKQKLLGHKLCQIGLFIIILLSDDAGKEGTSGLTRVPETGVKREERDGKKERKTF